MIYAMSTQTPGRMFMDSGRNTLGARIKEGETGRTGVYRSYKKGLGLRGPNCDQPWKIKSNRMV